MRRASPLALAVLLAISISPLASAPAAASRFVPRFAALPEDTAQADGPLDATGRYLVTLKPGKDLEHAKGKARGFGVAAERSFTSAVRGYSAKLSPDQLAELRTDPDVQAVVPDEVFTMTAQTRPTGVRRVFAPDNALARINGEDGDVTSGERVDADVAIVDTGIDKAQPDLNVAGGISCSTSNPSAWGDGNGHGTHVAGIVGALDNGFGVVGVAPGVRLWSVRILNSAGEGLLSWYVCGLDWIAAQRDPLDPSKPLFEAVNMSVAKTGKDDGNCGISNKDVIHQAICRLVASGVTVVAAAGNNSFNAANLKPASYNEVITVSALADSDGRPGGLGGNLCYSWGGYDRDDTFADFSNYGYDVDLIAPGKCIYSTLPDNRYGYISGTSMAAPHVTGAAALYKATRPLATPAQVRLALRAAGTQDWNTASDPDATHEPLLDVSHLVALGDWTLDATPDVSSAVLVGATGAAKQVPVRAIRAEDVSGDIALSVDASSPFDPDLAPGTLTGGATTATLSFTVPPGTPSGSYRIRIRATDGTRERVSDVPITVDGVAPSSTTASLRLRAPTVLTGGRVLGNGTWNAASDSGSGVVAYQVRWRIDGALGAATRVSAAARSANRWLTVGHAYSLQVRAQDRAGNWGAWTNSATFGPVLSEDRSPSLAHSGSWHRQRSPNLSGGSAIYATRKGAWVQRSFTGRAVGVVMTKGPQRGKAQIFVDGKLAATVDTRRSANQYRVLVWQRAWASAAPHTVRVVVLGTLHRPRVDVDAFVVAR